jgi:hypothetical protein
MAGGGSNKGLDKAEQELWSLAEGLDIKEDVTQREREVTKTKMKKMMWMVGMRNLQICLWLIAKSLMRVQGQSGCCFSK